MSLQLNEDFAGWPEARLRAKAWIGDAVLGLFARQWLSAREQALDTTAYINLTSNQFLATVGQPTKVEAKIGMIYENEGLEAAFTWIETHLLPRYLRQQANRKP